PDLPAKNHIAELVIHLPLTVALVSAYGVTGAALAWTVRISLDAILLAYGAARHGAFFEIPRARPLWVATGALIIVFGVVVGLLHNAPKVSPAATAGFLVTAAVAFGGLGWSKALSGEEKRAWLGLVPAGLRRGPAVSL
ncbi:MAG: polysaccharide biosynthesis protein, partial [Gemmatimonadaceae bacterium]|nr:polysaccharide biosynthesis protein [Gemmatimonadaceae bacterium]